MPRDWHQTATALQAHARTSYIVIVTMASAGDTVRLCPSAVATTLRSLCLLLSRRAAQNPTSAN